MTPRGRTAGGCPLPSSVRPTNDDARPLNRRSFLAASMAGAALVPSAVQGLTEKTAAAFPDAAADFPITASGRAFLNSAYIAPSPRIVAAAAAAFAHAKAERPPTLPDLLASTERARAKFAALINADADEVGLLFSTAEAENVIASGLDLLPGDNVVIDDLHYDTEFILYQQLERLKGIELRVARNRDGAVTADDFAPLVDGRTRLISVAWVSHRNGFRHDLRALADLAHAHKAYLYTDAIQGIGALPIDVRAEQVDFLCAGSYKWLFAGWGVAPFYVRRELAGRLRLDRFGEMHATRRDGGGYDIDATARRFDYSSRAFGEVHALDAALDYLDSVGVDRIAAHGVALARRLQTGASDLGYRLLTPPGNASPIVAIALPGAMDRARAAFEAAGIDVTVRGQAVRLATALFNRQEDVDRALDVLKHLV